MTGKNAIRRAVAAAFLALSAMHGVAWGQGALSSAQPLVFEFNSAGTASVNGTIGAASAAVYSFWANEGDVVTVDIDGTTNFIDTIVSVHTPAPAYAVDAVMDDASVIDSGSTTPLDPYIQNWVAPTSGLHYVAVTLSPDRVADGGTFLALGGAGSGDFTLTVSGVTPEPTTPPPSDPAPTDPTPTEPTPPPTDTGSTPSTDVQHVRIDVRPGSRALVRLNPKWREAIPVAILSSRTFDARKIDVSTLTFGRTGDEQSLRKCGKGFGNLNRDRRPDLLCHFENQAAAFELGDEEGVLKGMTVDGQAFEGRAMLKVVPQKRHYGHDHGKGHHKDADNDRRKGHPRKTSWWSW